MNSESAFILLFCVATAVAVAVRRIRVPYTIALVVTGLAIGSLGLVRPPRLTKDMLFTFFLPGLLFEAAFHLDLDAFRRIWKSTVALAVPGVIIGMLATAAILGGLLHLGGGRVIDWRFGLVFGAVVAATDPVAVTALFREVNAPAELAALVESESLFNDGTGIVLLTLVASLLRGTASSVAWVSGQFVLIAGGGVAVGLIVGVAIARMIRRIDAPMIEIALTTIACYGSFVLAEQIGVSGVLATVVAGMWCSRQGRDLGMSPTSRAAVESFWEYVSFALNSIVFLLIGFEFRPSSLLHLGGQIAAAFIAMLLARTGIVFLLVVAQRLLGKPMPWSWVFVLTWGGVRGALSMVLVLALPDGFPNRDVLVATTIGAVVLSLLVQGATMPLLVTRLGIGAERRQRIRATAS